MQTPKVSVPWHCPPLSGVMAEPQDPPAHQAVGEENRGYWDYGNQCRGAKKKHQGNSQNSNKIKITNGGLYGKKSEKIIKFINYTLEYPETVKGDMPFPKNMELKKRKANASQNFDTFPTVLAENQSRNMC